MLKSHMVKDKNATQCHMAKDQYATKSYSQISKCYNVIWSMITRQQSHVFNNYKTSQQCHVFNDYKKNVM